MESLIGKTINHWTVLSEQTHTTKGGIKVKAYKCRCVCGKEKIVLRQNLIRGASKSCGCMVNYVRDEEKHEFWKSRISRIYVSMISRCYNKKKNNYERYGGRGIGVCEEWRGKDGRLRFYHWAKSNGYDDSLSLDRIDNNSDYSPQNCKWSTAEEQGNNKRNNLFLTYNGETKTYTQWARTIGLKSGDSIKMRLNYGWTIEAAVTTPPSKAYTFNKHKNLACERIRNEQAQLKLQL